MTGVVTRTTNPRRPIIQPVTNPKRQATATNVRQAAHNDGKGATYFQVKTIARGTPTGKPMAERMRVSF